MSIDEAVVKLQAHLGDPEVFHVRADGSDIVVDVNFIYRLKEVTALGGVWEGYPVITGKGRGRVSCW